MKMILELPTRVDGENFVRMALNMVTGRYAPFHVEDDCYYYGKEISVSWFYGTGFIGTDGKRYYKINAADVDPIIIATFEELGSLCGLNYGFVTDDGKKVSHNWWLPARKDFRKRYIGKSTWLVDGYNNDDAKQIADEYLATLELLDGAKEKKFA